VVSVSERLQQKASRRTAEVRLDEDTFIVVEVDVDDFAQYGALAKQDRKEATAFLLSCCVLEEDAFTRALSIEVAREVAKSTRVTIPLVNKIMELSGFGGDEKKADAS
jgi:hypothetical protein